MRCSSSLKQRRWMSLAAAAAPREWAAAKKHYGSRLQQCAQTGSLDQGKSLHQQIVAAGLGGDVFLANLVVFMYSRCGDLDSARGTFDSMSRRNVVSWTILIGAYAQNGHCNYALELFQQMPRTGISPSSVTFVAALAACAAIGGDAGLHHGRTIHSQISETSEVVVVNSLINMYAKCGCSGDAKRVFDSAATRDVVSWTSLVAALGRTSDALLVFNKMPGFNEVTFITLIGACSNPTLLAEGRGYHSLVLAAGLDKSSVAVATALLTMYARCGGLDEARLVFSSMRRRDVIAWNAMIAANAQTGEGLEAIRLFRAMDQEGVKQDVASFISALDGCSVMGTEGLRHGRSIATRLLSPPPTTALGNTIVNMFGRCGSLVEARATFEAISTKDSVSWAALVAAYAHHGRWQEAKEVFWDMSLDGIQPAAMLFISILAACSHGGLVSEARYYFLSMVGDHALDPSPEHYGCILDSLGRVGRLEQVHELICTMPFEPGGLEWRSFLGACATHFDSELGADAANFASSLEPAHGAAYVLLSSFFKFGS